MAAMDAIGSAQGILWGCGDRLAKGSPAALHGAAVCPASCCSLPVLVTAATAPWSWVMGGRGPGCPLHPGLFWGLRVAQSDLLAMSLRPSVLPAPGELDTGGRGSGAGCR